MNCYVYRHRRVDTGEIFYVGIGSSKNYKRAYDKNYRNNHWHNIVNKTVYTVDIFLDNLTWEEACEQEKFIISLYGRRDLGTGCLVNMTDGGEGAWGAVRSEEVRRRMGVKNIGRKHTEDHIEKNRAANSGESNGFYGKKHSSETIKHLRQINLGKTYSEETKKLLRSQRTPDKHSASKIVLDTQTGVFFDCAREAAEAYGLKHSTLKSRLNGTVKNKTNLIYC